MILPLFAILFSVVPMAAAPLNITETVDFGTSFSLLGNLDVGVNVISGSVSGIPPSGGVDPRDTFAVTLLSGFRITGVEFLISLYNSGSGINPTPGFIQSTVSGNRGISSNGSILPANNLQYSASGNLTFDIGSPYNEDDVGRSSAGSFTYTIRYTVESTAPEVPEPSSALLSFAGLTMLAIALRRRSAVPSSK